MTTFSDLKTILHDQASGPSTVHVTQDIDYPTDGSSVPGGGIILKYPVRIVGACSSTSLVVSGTVAAGTCQLDAKEVDRHFYVKTPSTAEVVFEKLALVNGKKTGSDQGGAVLAYQTGATRFEDIIFMNNTISDRGGAVRAYESGKATFTSCRFVGNKALVRSSPISPPISFCLDSPLDLSRPSATVCQFVICTSDSLRFGTAHAHRAYCL